MVAVTGIVPGIALLADPSLLGALVGWFGHEQLPADVADSDGAHALARWVGTVLLGSNGLTLVIAAGPLRRGVPWAWWAMWYWPAMFVSHAAIYADAVRLPQLAWAVLTAAVLVAARPRATAARQEA